MWQIYSYHYRDIMTSFPSLLIPFFFQVGARTSFDFRAGVSFMAGRVCGDGNTELWDDLERETKTIEKKENHVTVFGSGLFRQSVWEERSTKTG